MTKDKELFWQLLEPEYMKTMLYCRRIMGNREQGDDLFQDSLVLGIQRFAQLRDVGSFRAWLYQIINSQFKSTIRTSKRRSWLTLTPEIEETKPQKSETGFPMARIWLDRILKNLPADEQTVIVMHELEKWRVSEIASLHGKSEGAIKLKLFRVRRKMKKELCRLAGANPRTLNDIFCELRAYDL